MTGTPSRSAHHETSDADVGSVVMFAIGLVVIAIGINLMVWLLLAYFSSREAVRGARQNPLAAAQESRLPPEPRLQTNPRQDLQDLRSQEDQTLNGYAWVDKNAGIVRIPIDEAMRLVVERGLPARKAAAK